MNRTLAALLWCAALLAACGDSGPPRDEGAPTGIRFLAEGAAEGYARASAPRPFEFPADHGPHPAFHTEWWYFTGNIAGESGRHYGFELTFFRVALDPAPQTPVSPWTTGQVWMAHFALTDTANQRFVAAERLSRGALDLAGARAAPFGVWVEDWAAWAPSGVLEDGVALQARTAQAGLDLMLEPLKPPVAHGDGGLDAKGPEQGNASFYYSMPRMAARGTIVDRDGAAEPVEGLAWMDREWGTSALSPGVVGWDWFALQLEDGRDLMLYRLRERGDGTSPFSGGSLIERDGTVVRLMAEDFTLEATRHWTSPLSGVRYPVQWRVALPGRGLVLEVMPRLDAQELSLSVRYWEGAVQTTGTQGGVAVRGHGYLELSGY